MQRRLYHFASCPYCEKVRLALALAGLDYASHEIDPADRSEVVAVSGQPLVPVLVEPDGTVLHESNLILRQLATLPEAQLLPQARRDQALTWVLVDRADAVLAPLCRRGGGGALHEELGVLEGLLERGPFLFGERPSLADACFHAFLNRMPAADRDRAIEGWPRVRGWYDRVVSAART